MKHDKHTQQAVADLLELWAKQGKLLLQWDEANTYELAGIILDVIKSTDLPKAPFRAGEDPDDDEVEMPEPVEPETEVEINIP